jgi:hypothetical protein
MVSDWLKFDLNIRNKKVRIAPHHRLGFLNLCENLADARSNVTSQIPSTRLIRSKLHLLGVRASITA